MLKDTQQKGRGHIPKQLDLLQLAERNGTSLAEILRKAGWKYDDLRYTNSSTHRWAGPPPLSLEELRTPENHIPVVSFFSGCGGMDLGLEAAGYQQVAAFEINELFCKTLRRNRPNWRVFGPPTYSGDVSDFYATCDLLRQLINAPFDGLFVGGPPCQPFSIAANQRFSKSGKNFKRVGFSHKTNGSLLIDFIRLILEFRPSVFVIENVPGLRDLDGGIQLRATIDSLARNGYHVTDPFVLDASSYGIPQQRQRLFVVGSRMANIFTPPPQLTGPIGAGSVLHKKQDGIPNSETREHKAQSILRYMTLDYGQRDPLGRVDRLDPRLPSKTVIAGGTNGGGRSHLHPEIPRTLSARECARLQTFPDNYVFVGPTARQFTQVGNAVPPVLAARIGQRIQEIYF